MCATRGGSFYGVVKVDCTPMALCFQTCGSYLLSSARPFLPITARLVPPHTQRCPSAYRVARGLSLPLGSTRACRSMAGPSECEVVGGHDDAAHSARCTAGSRCGRCAWIRNRCRWQKVRGNVPSSLRGEAVGLNNSSFPIGEGNTAVEPRKSRTSRRRPPRRLSDIAGYAMVGMVQHANH
jgi:hypothetical protein